MVGQEKLKAVLNGYTIDTLPKTLMLIGEKGCGKTSFAEALAKRLGLPVKNITKDTASSDLLDYSISPIATMYFIDLTDFDEKSQNQLLKFIEEPGENMYMLLMTRTEVGILPTILNRCNRLRFEPYTAEQLRPFALLQDVSDELLQLVCKTPGQVLEVDSKTVLGLYDLCQKIVKSITVATYANFLKITLSINFKENYDRYSPDFFLDMLEYAAFYDYRENNSELSLKIYLYTNKAKTKRLGKKLIEENFITNFLSGLWEEVRV